MVLGSQTGTAYFSSSCRPHGIENDYDIRNETLRSVSLVLLSCCTAIAEVPMVSVRLDSAAELEATMP